MRRTQNNQENTLTSSKGNDIMNSIYWLKSHRDDLYYLQDFVLKVYNDIVRRVPHFTMSAGTQDMITVFRPEAEMLKTEEWLELLLEVRMRELDSYEESFFLQNKIQLLQCYKIYGLQQAIDMIGHIASGLIKEIYERSRKNYSNT